MSVCVYRNLFRHLGPQTESMRHTSFPQPFFRAPWEGRRKGGRGRRDGRHKKCWTTSVQFLDRLGHQGDFRDDSAEIDFQSFLREALVSRSGMGRDVHSLTLSIQHFFCRPRLDGCCQRVDIPAHTGTAYVGLPQKRLEEDRMSWLFLLLLPGFFLYASSSSYFSGTPTCN